MTDFDERCLTVPQRTSIYASPSMVSRSPRSLPPGRRASQASFDVPRSSTSATTDRLRFFLGTRVIVESSIFEEFLDALRDKCASIERRIGSPFSKDSMMGPLISARQLSIVEELVENAKKQGGIVACGGSRLSGKSNVDDSMLENG